MFGPIKTFEPIKIEAIIKQTIPKGGITMSFLTPKSRVNKPTQADPFYHFQEEMNRLMETFFGQSNWPSLSETTTWAPKVDVSETEKEYKVRAELPGVDKKNVELSFQDNTLFLKGERKFEEEEKKENFHRVERSFGTFQRMIPFNTKVDEEKIKANYDKGILTITMAKTDDALKGTRKISISGE